MSYPNKLLRLAGQVEALPKQDALRQAKNQFEAISSRTTTLATSLSQSFAQLRVLRQVVDKPQHLSRELKVPCGSLRKVAQELTQQAKADRPETPRIQSALDTLGKQSGVVAGAVSLSWDEANRDEIEVTKALIDLTSKFDTEAQARLQSALNTFKGVGRPSDPAAIERYTQARSRLQTLRQELSLPGSVGQFLTEAMLGRGSISSLMSAEVQEFLKQNPILKSRLTVKLS